MTETKRPETVKRPLRARLTAFAIWFVFAVALGVVLGLVAEELLGIHYRWGLFLGIGIATAIEQERRDRSASKRRVP